MNSPAYIRTNRYGFTLIELMIVMGILAILVGGAIANFNSFARNQRLTQTAKTVVTNLKLVQTKAITGDKSECPTGSSFISYSVSFAATGFGYFINCTGPFTGSMTSIKLPTEFENKIYPVTFQFNAITGATNLVNDAEITIQRKNSTDTIKVYVSKSGLVYMQ